jgi:exodeoxyribonuclease VII large subunit
MAAITPPAAAESIGTSRNDFLASGIEPLEQQLEAACEAFDRSTNTNGN